MHFRFHIDTGKTTYLDTKGVDFIDLDVARQYGILLIRNFFLAHPARALKCCKRPAAHHQ
jgi:hypothetical protein